jgi:HEAT repeat protein
MSTKHWIRQLRSSPHLSEQLRAVRHLKETLDLPTVHTALCITAVDTRRQPLRAALMAALQEDTRAEAYFLGVVRGEGPTYMRQWALLNLGIMGSRRAREVVLEGLQDPSIEVRRAAASHVTLYTDEVARQAFIHYFQTEREIYLRDAASRLGRGLRGWWHGLKAIRLMPVMRSIDTAGQAHSRQAVPDHI